MSLKHGILSLLLLFFVLLLGIKNYEIWTLPIELGPEKGETKKSGVKIENPPTIVGKKETTPIESYIFVAEKNIFNPERKDFPVIAPPPAVPEVKKPIVRPQIILYGVTIGGDYQSAFVVNPGRPLKKGERELMTLKVGDQIGEYKLATILSDRITMEATEDKFEVLLYDAKSPKQRTYAKTESKPATVTSTLSTPAAMPTAVSTPPPPTPAPGPSAAPTPARTRTPSTPTITPPQPSPPTSTPPSGRLTRERNPVLPPDGLISVGPYPRAEETK
jgi:hypothetical protein